MSFTPIGHKNRWSGCDWSIEDDDELAQLIARVALGQYRHVLHILAETDCLLYAPAPSALEGARKLLTATNEPWQRDGWLFQVVSWIAANLQGDTSLIAPPHMIHAHKGFDGLHVYLDPETRRVALVVICEEKATGNPRRMIKDEVWKDFESLERGERDNELVAEVSALVVQRQDIDPDQAIREILWNEARAYRIAITVSDKHADDNGRENLFKGYNETVTGDLSRRRAETLYLNDLRSWMTAMAAKAVAAAEVMEAQNV